MLSASSPGWLLGMAMSVVPGRGAGGLGFRPFSKGPGNGTTGEATPVSVPLVCGDACVVAGDVAAAQGLWSGAVIRTGVSGGFTT